MWNVLLVSLPWILFKKKKHSKNQEIKRWYCISLLNLPSLKFSLACVFSVYNWDQQLSSLVNQSSLIKVSKCTVLIVEAYFPYIIFVWSRNCLRGKILDILILKVRRKRHVYYKTYNKWFWERQSFYWQHFNKMPYWQYAKSSGIKTRFLGPNRIC